MASFSVESSFFLITAVVDVSELVPRYLIAASILVVNASSSASSASIALTTIFLASLPTSFCNFFCLFAVSLLSPLPATSDLGCFLFFAASSHDFFIANSPAGVFLQSPSSFFSLSSNFLYSQFGYHLKSIPVPVPLPVKLEETVIFLLLYFDWFFSTGSANIRCVAVSTKLDLFSFSWGSMVCMLTGTDNPCKDPLESINMFYESNITSRLPLLFQLPNQPLVCLLPFAFSTMLQ